MGIRRACSYIVRIKTPIPPESYSSKLVTIQQKKRNLVSKKDAQLTIEDNRVVMKLTQAETQPFEAGVIAYLQFRGYIDEYNAPGSKCWPVEVWPALDDQILGGE